MLPPLVLPILACIVGAVALLHLKRGAVFVPTERRVVSDIVQALEIRAGERVADLGSGDGRLVIAMAAAGAEAHGFEHSLLLVWISRWRIRRAGLSDKAFIHRQNFWKSDLSRFSAITVFGINYVMKPLEDKLLREGKGGLRVVSYVFPFPNLQPVLSRNGFKMYRF